MKNLLWIVAGFCAAAVGFLIWSPPRTPSVPLLADRRKEVCTDHSVAA